MFLDKERFLNGNEPSEEQIKLCEFVAHGVGNAVVQARAGCGKSKTIELMCSVAHPRKKILVVAHNRHIADSITPKMKEICEIDGRKIDVMTYHQLGLKILHLKYSEKKISVDEDKYTKYIGNNIDILSDGGYESLSSIEKYKYKKNLFSLVEYSRFNKSQSLSEISEISKKYDVKIVLNECEAVKKILEWGSKNFDTVDFSDMIWLPYEFNIRANIPSLQYDLIFVDEAQDSSIVQQNLIEICKYRKTRLFIFGDENQTINAWCGADDEAFKKFNDMDNVVKFSLNTSYRCSNAVADHVRELIPDLKTPKNAISGSVNYNVTSDKIAVGDMVLCRMTSPLISLHLKLMSLGIPSKVIGHNIGVELIERLKKLESYDMNVIINDLYSDLFRTWDGLAKEHGCELKDVVSESSIISGYDEIQTLEVASEGLTNKNDVIERLKNMFVDDDDVVVENTVVLSTVHRAKGLESDNVFILCPSLMPSKLAKTEMDVKGEFNIMYVARSRAKVNLNYISEKEFPTKQSYLGINEMYKELMLKRNEGGN